jgi:hypothetical protein
LCPSFERERERREKRGKKKKFKRRGDLSRAQREREREREDAPPGDERAPKNDIQIFIEMRERDARVLLLIFFSFFFVKGGCLFGFFLLFTFYCGREAFFDWARHTV